MEQISVEAAAGYGQVILQTLVSGLLAGIVASVIQMAIDYAMKKKDQLLAQKTGWVDPAQFVPGARAELARCAAEAKVDPASPLEGCLALKSVYRMALPYVCGSRELRERFEAMEACVGDEAALAKEALLFREKLLEALAEPVKTGA